MTGLKFLHILFFDKLSLYVAQQKIVPHSLELQDFYRANHVGLEVLDADVHRHNVFYVSAVYQNFVQTLRTSFNATVAGIPTVNVMMFKTQGAKILDEWCENRFITVLSHVTHVVPQYHPGAARLGAELVDWGLEQCPGKTNHAPFCAFDVALANITL
jgi:hypothetical protein